MGPAGSQCLSRASCDGEWGQSGSRLEAAFGEGQSWDLNAEAEQRHTSDDIKDVGQNPLEQVD